MIRLTRDEALRHRARCGRHERPISFPGKSRDKVRSALADTEDALYCHASRPTEPRPAHRKIPRRGLRSIAVERGRRGQHMWIDRVCSVAHVPLH